MLELVRVEYSLRITSRPPRMSRPLVIKESPLEKRLDLYKQFLERRRAVQEREDKIVSSSPVIVIDDTKEKYDPWKERNNAWPFMALLSSAQEYGHELINELPHIKSANVHLSPIEKDVFDFFYRPYSHQCIIYPPKVHEIALSVLIDKDKRVLLLLRLKEQAMFLSNSDVFLIQQTCKQRFPGEPFVVIVLSNRNPFSAKG